MKNFYVYLLASENNHALYTGITNNLERRLHEHKQGIGHGYTKKYNCKKLVHFETFDDPENAIAREKDIKGWVRRRKNELIEKNNPSWRDLSAEWHLDPSGQALQDDQKTLTTAEWSRYARQLALPEISAAQQIKLNQSRILMIGAGGLGSASLPYLAAAGVGHITIMDNDTVDPTNLHRQTIYRDDQAGQSKAELAVAYLSALNPHCDVVGINARLTCHPEALALKDLSQTIEDPSRQAFQDDNFSGFDLILDGSDNFETKTLLNEIAMEMKTPLLSASINRFESQAGIFAGHAKDQPCYHCLFPDLPQDACNCNEAGVLGTAAGLAGTYQAHMALCFLLGLDNLDAGSILTFDFKRFRVQHLKLKKDPDCKHCQHADTEWKGTKMDEAEIPVIDPKDLSTKDHMIIDVRTDEEVLADPIKGALHIELQTIPARFSELPEDKLLAFACVSNIRSMQAAEFMRTMGYENVCVYDKLAG